MSPQTNEALMFRIFKMYGYNITQQPLLQDSDPSHLTYPTILFQIQFSFIIKNTENVQVTEVI